MRQINGLTPDEQSLLQQDIDAFIAQAQTLSPQDSNTLSQLLGGLATRFTHLDGSQQQVLLDQVEQATAEFAEQADEDELADHILEMARLTDGFDQLSPTEQISRLQEIRINLLIDEMTGDVWAWRRGEIPPEDVPHMIDALLGLAKDVSEIDEELGAYSQDLAQFITAVAATLNGHKNPPVPDSLQQAWQMMFVTPPES
ncbi:MAG: hypothetical protein F6K62_26890 [Sphaerospermopsis sp. SIO1G2]|nr:hypothetical protein [Sphaerospermopsis sp. SIO1G2]